jgi:hypothetical protein
LFSHLKQGSEDVLIVSIGGNDIALRPSLTTMLSVSWLALIARDETVAGLKKTENENKMMTVSQQMDVLTDSDS